MKILPNKFILILSGILIGAVNGLLGGGGGMIVVPVLQGVLKQESKKAHATAILIILPITIMSAIIYIVSGKVDWSMLAFSSIGVVVGGVAGALLLTKLSNKFVRISFSIIMVAVGVKMLFF